MTKVTVIALHSSYATMLKEKYREEEIFSHLDEDVFLTVVAKNMKTSKEQQFTSYIGIDSSDFEVCAQELVRTLSNSDDGYNSDMTEPGENIGQSTGTYTTYPSLKAGVLFWSMERAAKQGPGDRKSERR